MEPSTPRHARLSARHIARLGELTKREIQVLCFLFLSRNGSNNRCDPRRKTIAAGVGLAMPHITIALAGLESKGWVLEMPDGGFHLFDADDIPPVEKDCGKAGKVTKLVTKTRPDPAEKVTKLVTDVTESVTENYQNGNSLNKDLNNKENRKENKERAPRSKSIKRKSKEKPKATRIPKPFDLTDEMLSWFWAHVADLADGPIAAHLDFVEYWTNAPENKKAYATDWPLRWQKGMTLLLKWQRRDDRRAAGIDPPPDPGCKNCDGTGRVLVNFFNEPCERCQPNRAIKFQKGRGK